ncbi:MAG: hypothetical protein WC997_13035 [Porticoccaceae bacterium]
MNPVGKTHRRNGGAAVLAVTLIVLLLATIGVLMVAQAGVAEQRLSGIDVRGKEVHSAATGALDFGVAWLKHHWHDLHWQNTGSGAGPGARLDSHADGLTPALQAAQMMADSYQHQVAYRLLTPFHVQVGGPPIAIRVAATARGAADSHVTKTVTQDVMVGYASIFGATSDPHRRGIFSGPPLIIENCIAASASGGLRIVHDAGSGALGTTQGLASGAELADCLDVAHLPAQSLLCERSGECGSPTALLAAGGEFRTALVVAQPLWQVIFGSASKADLHALERLHPGRVLVVDNGYPRYAEQPPWSDGIWRASLPADFSGEAGSEQDPVILFFDASVGCPTLAEGVHIHGLVYVEKDDCAGLGWGGGQVHGTLAKAGDFAGLAQHTVLVAAQLDYAHADNDATHGSPVAGVTRIFVAPGSWHDY